MNPLSTLTAALAERYAVEREIGSGGMATVYLARDIRHDRQVALKVLKPELGAVLGVERFLSEIRVTAHLQHPNLLPLFDSGEVNGLLYYVMPYVAGESLRARLVREQQLPVEEAVRIAVAIAGALQTAHDAGVVHRDLKPENILLQAGQPVVADFGIALAVSNAGGARVTQTGLSLGTPQYMSPEQATGDRAIDGRSDIYSLGAMLYEMLTGEPPHAGPTAQAIIAKLLTEDVRSLTILRRTVPMHVDSAVRRALERLPADRWASARDFAAALQGKAPITTGAQPVVRHSLKRRWPLLAAGVAGIVIGAVIAQQVLATRAPSSSGAVRYVLDLEANERIVARISAPFAVSPDGHSLAYAASRGGTAVQLYIRSLDNLRTRLVPGTEGVAQLTYSPDGRWIAFIAGPDIKKVNVDAGTVVTLGRMSAGAARGMLWVHRDTILIGSVSGGIRAVGASGGAVRTRYAVPPDLGATSLRWPVSLGDDKTIAFVANSGGVARTLYMTARLDGDSTSARPLMVGDAVIRGGQPLGFMKGSLIYVSPVGVVTSVPFDREHSRVTGTPLASKDQVFVDVSTTSTRAMLSASGSLMYQAGSEWLKPVLVDHAGRETALDIDSGSYAFPRFSPDGRRIAFTMIGTDGSRVWVYDRSAGTRVPLTPSDGGANDRPEWTRDGKRIMYRSTVGENAIWWRASDGSGSATMLQARPKAQVPEGVMSPVADVFVFRTLAEEVDGLYYRTLTDTTMRPLLQAAGVYYTGPRFSPDGKWVAYSSEESGLRQVYVTPFPAGQTRLGVSVEGGDEPVWSPDGKHIYYAHAQQMIDATITLSPTFSVSRRVMFEGPYVFQYLHQNFDLTPDGKYFLLLRASVDAKTVVVHNWASELP